MEKTSFNIVSSILYLEKVIGGNAFGILAFVTAILSLSTGGSESILQSLGAPFLMNIIGVVIIIIFLSLSFRYFKIKPKYGELLFERDFVTIKNGKDTSILYKDISRIELYLNNKKNKQQYTREFIDGYNNWIVINGNYIIELYLRSIKTENDLIHLLKTHFGDKLFVSSQKKHLLLSSNWYKTTSSIEI